VLVFFQILFYFSAYAIVHTYIVYPCLLYVFSKNRKNKTGNLYALNDALPSIAVICAAYNEERVIEEKIKSVFITNYPKEKISFYIGTDACSDSTVAIIKSLQTKYPLLKLVEFTERSGKINILNKLCSLAEAEVFVMTDANVYFKEDTFFELVKHFKNEDIKLVCGNIVKRALNEETVTKNELQYLNFENFLKNAESNLWQIVIGAEGGCYALRRDCYLNIPPHFIADDFFITCHVLNTDGKILFEENAVVHEDASAETKGEFRRKARIATGNFQNLVYFKNLLKKPFSKIGFAYISHKVLRWLTPFFFLINLICCAFLTADNFLFEYILAIELAILFSPVLNSLFEKMGVKIKPLISASHFVVMNRALVVGFVRYCRGVTSSVWQPVRQ
jgi:cellulose synthase/poly-beta-1,6-N-acetylglucosamine synthase-like glycosyltransferase